MSNKKMTTKGADAPGFSLDDFIAGADPVSEAPKTPSKAPTTPKRTNRPKLTSKAVGKPPGPPEKVRNATVQIKLTTAELEAVKKKAGRVPVSSYLRDELQKNGVI